MPTFKATLKIVFLLALFSTTFSSLMEPRSLSYSSEAKRESVRLYGNINTFAYWFVDLLVGTPPQRTSAIIDTGSTVSAFACDICKECGTHLDAAFKFLASSTATWTSCSPECPSGSCRDDRCSYSISYVEGSSLAGYWFTDVVRLGDQAEGNIPVNSSLGCHTSETKLFYTQSVNGILGLGPSKVGSFPNILSSLFGDARINKALFSVCLSSEGGEMVVGGYDAAFHAGNQMWWIPLTIDSFYSVPLTRMRVGNSNIGSVFGRTIMDSGTTLSYFPGSIYRALAEQVEAYGRHYLKQGTRCYTTNQRSIFPTIFLEFNDAISIAWTPEEYLFNFDKDTVCLGFQEVGRTETVLGASFFINKNIVFDTHSARLGIAPAACPSHSGRPGESPTAALAHANSSLPVKQTNSSSVMAGSSFSDSDSESDFPSAAFFVWPLLIVGSVSFYIYWRRKVSSAPPAVIELQ